MDRGMYFFHTSPFPCFSFLVPLGLRLADKRSLPCPNRLKWLEARDELYEEIMIKAWNNEGKYFGQTYEDTSALDSCVLIMPLVFFISAVSFFFHYMIFLLSIIIIIIKPRVLNGFLSFSLLSPILVSLAL